MMVGATYKIRCYSCQNANLVCAYVHIYLESRHMKDYDICTVDNTVIIRDVNYIENKENFQILLQLLIEVANECIAIIEIAMINDIQRR